MSFQKHTAILIITLYQRILSPDKGFLRHLYPIRGACAMYPTCSEYMVLTIKKRGVILGVTKGILRIGRCHPWQKELVDIP